MIKYIRYHISQAPSEQLMNMEIVVNLHIKQFRLLYSNIPNKAYGFERKDRI